MRSPQNAQEFAHSVECSNSAFSAECLASLSVCTVIMNPQRKLQLAIVTCHRGVKRWRPRARAWPAGQSLHHFAGNDMARMMMMGSVGKARQLRQGRERK